MRSKVIEPELVADWQTSEMTSRHQADGSSCGIFVLMVSLCDEK